MPIKSEDVLTKLEAENVVRHHRALFGDDLNHPLCQAAVIMLLGIGRRKHLDDLGKVSGFPRPFIKTCLKNLKNAGIFDTYTKHVYASWENNPVTLFTDAATAVGVIARV